MHSGPILFVILCAIALPACAQMPTNPYTLQSLSVETDPPGAACSLTRAGETIGEIATTPGSAIVTRTKYDIIVVCRKDGYRIAQKLNVSGTSGASIARGILIGGIGGVIGESIAGSDNRYDPVTQLALSPRVDGAPADVQGTFGCPASGTVLHNSLGNEIEARPSSGYGCHFIVKRTGKEFTNVAVVTGSGARPELREAAVGVWPLVAGTEKDVDFMGEGPAAGRMFHEHYLVTGPEQITVQAGTFRVYRIVAEQAANQGIYRDRETYWWSPDVNWTVKFTHESLQGEKSNKHPNWELISISAPAALVATGTP
jgi:hypothetical protein